MFHNVTLLTSISLIEIGEYKITFNTLKPPCYLVLAIFGTLKISNPKTALTKNINLTSTKTKSMQTLVNISFIQM